MAPKTNPNPANLPRTIYRDNQISVPAFELLELAEADLSNHVIRGVIRIRMGDFRLRRPRRVVRKFPYLDAHAGENPASNGTAMDTPPQLPGRRTMWDIDAADLFDPALAQPQRVMIRIVLDDDLTFWPPEMLPTITAKDAASQRALVNLRVDTNRAGKPRATFWALRPAGANTIVQHSFNIAVIAPDDSNANFSLPVIIDPSVRNRG
jgi:hypothetical protein